MNDHPQRGRNPLIYIVLLAIGITTGGLLVYIFHGGQKQSEPLPFATQKAETKTTARIKYWQAPMDPTYVRNKPGRSPMGMELIPVYESTGEEEAGVIRIDPVTIQNMGVRTTKIKKTRLVKTVTTVGRVDYDEKRIHRVNTKVEGWVNKLFVDFTGKKVKKDDYLLEIYSPKLVTTQEEYLLAKSYDKKDNKDDSGDSSVALLARKRLEFMDVPSHQIKELEESGVVMKYIHIHSPATGVVVEKNVNEGMFIKPGTPLYTIADLSRVWVYADIYEYELPWIKTGQEAEITLAAYPADIFRGRVAFINPFMDPKTRTVKVRLEFKNPDGRLKPDMFANVTLRSQRKKAAVVVPTEAVLLSGERNIVIIARGEGRFAPREIELGIEANDHYEVTKGLRHDEEIVTSAHFLIDSESRLREAISKMLETDQQEQDPAWIKHERIEHNSMGKDELSVHLKDHETNGHDETHHMITEDTEMEHDDIEHDETPHKETEHKEMPEMDHSEMNHEGSIQ